MYKSETLEAVGTIEFDSLPGFDDLVTLDLAELEDLAVDVSQLLPPQGANPKDAFNSVAETTEPAFQVQF